MNIKQLREEARLTPEEIKRAAYQRNKLFGENDVLAYTRKPNADEAIAQAQQEKDFSIFSDQTRDKCPACKGKGKVPFGTTLDGALPALATCGNCDGTGKGEPHPERLVVLKKGQGVVDWETPRYGNLR